MKTVSTTHGTSRGGDRANPTCSASRRAVDTLDPSAIIDYALSQGQKSDLADLRDL